MNRSGSVLASRVAAAGLLLAAGKLAALGLEWDSGLALDVDTTLTWGAQWRVEEAKSVQLRRLPAGWGSMSFGERFDFLTDPDVVVAQNMDDGNNSFGTGLISNRVTALMDIELTRGNYGAFLRAKAFYDDVYANGRNDMDPVGYATMNNAPTTRRGAFVDETEDEHGSHAEFLDAYVHGTFDVAARELNLRVGRQVINWGESTFFPGVNGLQNRFDASVQNVPGTEVKEIFLPTGAVYAQFGLTDALALETYYQYEWKHTILNGVGSYFSQQDFLGPGADWFYLGVLELYGLDPRLPRRPDEEPDEQGQYGVALRYSLDSGAEIGFYYLNEHNKAPSFQRFGEPLPTDWQLRYFDDIRALGASFTTIVGDTQVNGELSYRANAPFSNAAGIPRREEQLQAQIGFTQVFRPTSLWDDLSVVGEIVGVDVVGRSGDEMAYDARAFACALRAEFAYTNVMEALDLAVPVFVMHTLQGTLREANMVDDALVASIGVRGTWRNLVVAELVYANYSGGGFDNWLTDRDNVAFNIKYSF